MSPFSGCFPRPLFSPRVRGGTLMDPERKLRTARRTGFGIVVVDYQGYLIAYGNGNPPAWITDSAGAETWALFVTLSMTWLCPDTVTDCFNIFTLHILLSY